MNSMIPRKLLQRSKITWNKIRNKLAKYDNAGELAQYARIKLAFWLKLTRVPALPLALDVEPVNYCNFRCPHCQVTHWEKARKRLTLTEFRKILAQFPRLSDIKLQGMGEPLLNREFLPMLREGVAQGINMQFTTNGSVLTDAICATLAEMPEARITFSIDGATAESFRSIRVGGNLDTVSKNIRRLAQTRASADGPHLAVWTVVTQENVLELPEIVRLAASLGIDEITLQPLLTDWGKADIEAINQSKRLELDSPMLQRQFSLAKQVAAELGLPLTVYRTEKLSRQNKCSWPWQSAYIDSKGDVVPCCIIADADTVTMGNVFETSFEEVWNGAAYQELRRRIRDHDLPAYCRSCYRDPDG